LIAKINNNASNNNNVTDNKNGGLGSSLESISNINK
jgi:hypothetical protein